MKKVFLINYIYLLLAIFYFNSIAFADYLDFEGYIFDSKNAPINKTIKMKFDIYDASGTSKWSIEKFITVNQGIIKTKLGIRDKIDAYLLNGNHYVGISIKENDKYTEILSRHKLTDNKVYLKRTLTDLGVINSAGDITIEGKLLVKGSIETNGEIKIGNSQSECNNTTEGSIRYNSIYKVIEYCNGNIWKNIGNNISPPPYKSLNSCEEILKHNPSSSDGIYIIDPDGDGGHLPFQVYCDMSKGGWIVIQRRHDGSTDFYRDWVDYKDGFGSLTGDFWLGNDKIHILTNSITSKLRIDMMNHKGMKKYAEYSTFSIENESEKYQLSIKGYSGTAGDSLLSHNGYNFITKDSEDSKSYCSRTYKGAWWYFGCYWSNLNGVYYKDGKCSSDGIVWDSWQDSDNKKFYSLPFVEMKIK